MTLDEIKELVHVADPDVDDDNAAFRCAVVLLAAAATEVGQDPEALR